MRVRSTLALVLFVLGGTIACDRNEIPPPRDPSDYDRHCVTDEDCVLVFARECSCVCNCPSALGAVNRSDLEHFRADEATRPCPKVYHRPFEGCISCDCPGDGRVPMCQCGLCEAVFPDAGRCVSTDGGN